jgi:hypothetical protein
VLHFGREDGNVWVSYNDGEKRYKLGRETMAKIEPRFPLKRIDYADTHFIPNIAEQNKIPIFSDISVVDLFSTLFSTMAKLSQRSTDLKRDLNGKVSLRDTTKLNLDYAKTKKLEFETAISVEKTKYPELDRDYARLVKIHNLKLKYRDLTRRATELKGFCTDPEKIRMVAKVEAARDLFPAYQYLQGVSQLVDMKISIQKTLAARREVLEKLPSAGEIDLVQSVGDILISQRKRKSLMLALAKYPDTLELFTILGSVRRFKRNVQDYWMSLSKLDSEIADVDKQLKAMGCPVFSRGLCPKGFGVTE